MGLGEAGAGGTRGKLDLGALGGNLEPWALVLPQAEPAVSPAHPAPAAADRSQAPAGEHPPPPGDWLLAQLPLAAPPGQSHALAAQTGSDKSRGFSSNALG